MLFHNVGCTLQPNVAVYVVATLLVCNFIVQRCINGVCWVVRDDTLIISIKYKLPLRVHHCKLSVKIYHCDLMACQTLQEQGHRKGGGVVGARRPCPYSTLFVCRGGGGGVGTFYKCLYRVCGLAVTACIAVKFGTAHGRSRLGVGSAKCIGSYGRKGVPPAPCNFGAF